MKKRTDFKGMIKIIYSLFICSSLMMQCVVFAEEDKSIAAINNSVNNIVNVIAWFGYAVAFGMFVYVGIKYMMASANERADVKRGAVNYIIGAFLIAAASTVANMIVKIAIGSGGAGTVGGLAGQIIDAANSAAGR